MSISKIGMAILLAVMLSACGSGDPVKPLPEVLKKSIGSLSAEVGGRSVISSTYVGARGSADGAARSISGAPSTYAYSPNPVASGVGSVVGLLIVAGAGAASARSPEEVDTARAGLRAGLESVHIGNLLGASLTQQRNLPGVPRIEIAGATAAAAAQDGPSRHILRLTYVTGVGSIGPVRPDVFPVIHVRAEFIAPDGKTVLHTNQWQFCGVAGDFMAVGANGGAFLRSELERGAAVLGEAIPFDSFVSQNPRARWWDGPMAGCMEFKDLPSGAGKAPPRPARLPEPDRPTSSEFRPESDKPTTGSVR